MGQAEDLLRRKRDEEAEASAVSQSEQSRLRAVAEQLYAAETKSLWLEIHHVINDLVKELDRLGWPEGELKTVATITPKQFGRDKKQRNELAMMPVSFIYGGDFDVSGPYVTLHVGSDCNLYDFSQGRQGRLNTHNHKGWGLNVFLKTLLRSLKQRYDELKATS